MILLNPGPVNLSERVRKALLRPDLCHRETEFADLQQAIRDKLLDVYGLANDDWAAVLLTGSGTAAVEAMLTSMVPREGRLLVIENGVYGERMSQIAAVHGVDHERLPHAWDETIAVEALQTRLNASSGITHVAVVHHETTSGRLNPLAEIGELCKARNIALLVDGVSSFGAEDLAFDGWGIGACAATANKCLHGVPGASFVLVRRDSLRMARAPKRSLYLDLDNYCRLQDEGSTPFTHSVQTLYALNEALDELADEGGYRTRYRRYAELIGMVRAGLTALGIQALLPAEASSVVLNAFRLPRDFTYPQFHDRLKDNGFVIYAGQGNWVRTLFRVSTMGAVTRADLDRFLSVVAELVT